MQRLIRWFEQRRHPIKNANAWGNVVREACLYFVPHAGTCAAVSPWKECGRGWDKQLLHPGLLSMGGEGGTFPVYFVKPYELFQLSFKGF